jgi:hypothetical protein
MRGYIDLNRNIPTFGAYGVIMIRDRKISFSSGSSS